ncbi:MAG: nucleotidyltransferase domain-containing protein [bacterium]
MNAIRTKSGRVSMRAIRAVVQQIVDQWHPEKVILFGSHAYGKPTVDSDVDLLVIMPVTEDRGILTGRIRAGLRPGFGIDLLVRSPETARERAKIDGTVIADAFRRGLVLYETGY